MTVLSIVFVGSPGITLRRPSRNFIQIPKAIGWKHLLQFGQRIVAAHAATVGPGWVTLEELPKGAIVDWLCHVLIVTLPGSAPSILALVPHIHQIVML